MKIVEDCIENYRGFREIYNLFVLMLIIGGGFWVRVLGRGCVSDFFRSVGYLGGKF